MRLNGDKRLPQASSISRTHPVIRKPDVVKFVSGCESPGLNDPNRPRFGRHQCCKRPMYAERRVNSTIHQESRQGRRFSSNRDVLVSSYTRHPLTTHHQDHRTSPRIITHEAALRVQKRIEISNPANEYYDPYEAQRLSDEIQNATPKPTNYSASSNPTEPCIRSPPDAPSGNSPALTH